MFTFICLAGLGLLAFQTWLITQLVQQGGRVLLRLDALEKQGGGKAGEPPAAPPVQGLPVGEKAPEFSLENLDGRAVSLEQLRSGGKPVLLLFTNPGCGPCTALLPDIANWQLESGSHFNLTPISTGTVEQNREKLKSLRIENVLLEQERAVSQAYDAQGTPSAVLVRPDGAIGSVVAVGAEAIRTLVSNTINESLAGLVAIQLQEGDIAPPLVYPDLDGKMFNFSELRGSASVLLFWNPGCGYCQQMTEDVKNWEKKASKSSPRLVLISTGTVEDNRKAGFRSRVLLDQNFSAGKSFGAGGTPSAILLNREGKIASKVAVGKPDIFESILSGKAAANVSA